MPAARPAQIASVSAALASAPPESQAAFQSLLSNLQFYAGKKQSAPNLEALNWCARAEG